MNIGLSGEKGGDKGSRMLELHGTLLMLRLHFFSIMRHAGMASA